MPVFDWEALCGNKGRGAVWNTREIPDCVGSIGQQLYKLEVKDTANAVEKSSYLVDFRPPNRYRLEAQPTNVQQVQNRTWYVSPKTVTFKYKNSQGVIEDIGPCTVACVRENWRFRPNKTLKWVLEKDWFNHAKVRGFPKCPQVANTTNYMEDGSHGLYAGGTWRWNPPTLTDIQWSEDFQEIQNEPDGTVIGTVPHCYRIKGVPCGGDAAKTWKLRTKIVELRWIVRTRNGQKVIEIRPFVDGVETSVIEDELEEDTSR